MIVPASVLSSLFHCVHLGVSMKYRLPFHVHHSLKLEWLLYSWKIELDELKSESARLPD